MYNNYTNLEIVRLHFNASCCEAKGVPEECMGLCREKVESRSFIERAIQMVMPVDLCAEHQDVISTCLVQEGNLVSFLIELAKFIPIKYNIPFQLNIIFGKIEITRLLSYSPL